MDFDVTLLIAGLLLIVVGVVGQVKFKEVEIGTKYRAARITLGLLGLVLTIVSFNPLMVKGLLIDNPKDIREPSGENSGKDSTISEKPSTPRERESPGTDAAGNGLPEEHVEYMIRLKANNQYLHEDGGADSLLSTRFQTTDGYSRFIFERYGDQSYRIKVVEHGRYLHMDGGGDKLVSTRAQEPAADPFTRFWIEPQDDGSVKFKSVGDDKYWYLDESNRKLLSTRIQTDNGFSRFYLDKR